MPNFLSTLAQATSNAIKAAHSEFNTSLGSAAAPTTDVPTITSTSTPETKSAIPLRMKLLNDTQMLEKYRESFLDTS
jgi:hypothetical protein